MHTVPIMKFTLPLSNTRLTEYPLSTLRKARLHSAGKTRRVLFNIYSKKPKTGHLQQIEYCLSQYSYYMQRFPPQLIPLRRATFPTYQSHRYR